MSSTAGHPAARGPRAEAQQQQRGHGPAGVGGGLGTPRGLHSLPTGSPLQLTFSSSSSSSSTMSRRLFTARLDSFSCGQTDTGGARLRPPHRGAPGWEGGGGPTWHSSSSSSSKVKARHLELCQYSSSSARGRLICNGSATATGSSAPPQRLSPRPPPAARSPLTSPHASGTGR